jgi:hypothetical protein
MSSFLGGWGRYSASRNLLPWLNVGVPWLNVRVLGAEYRPQPPREESLDLACVLRLTIRVESDGDTVYNQE